MTEEIFVGIDVGSSTAKSVVIDPTGKILSHMVKKTGVDMKNIAHDVYEQSLKPLNLDKSPNYIVSTGYGRKNVSFANTDITEITCTAKGANYYFPVQATIVDIGGQDNKVIFIGENGIIREFKLNRKCAAGTGAFLEEICWRLDIPIEEMQSIARKSTTMNVLSSYCSVFASTEILERIRLGEKIEDLLLSSYNSIIRRIFDMGQLENPVILSGGVVQYHQIIEEILNKKYNFKTLKTDLPQILPAFGAALIAKEKYTKNDIKSKKAEINIVLK